jgi:hypothetical protein
MPRFATRHYAVGTAAPVAIGTALPDIVHEITVYNNSNHEIYIGGTAVNTVDGFNIPKNTMALTFKITDGDILFAIAGSTGAVLEVYDYQVNL